jgi:2-polyprenyl-3-methyl-5-hydroxy-6-metoxy-1,4-benzoquinol methylase
MPTVEENRDKWSIYKWSEEGDEWSSEWGGTEYLWYGTIFPRIQAFLPTGNILEIAPGYGRCTQYLLSLCRELTVVDLTENCINACQERFKTSTHIKYFINDGKSLDMINDNSIDFVFSWDSLVHAESDVLFSYLEYLSLKLKPGGFGFLHHSNLGSFKNARTDNLTIENPHWRALSMTAELFREYCKNVGLSCISQEIVNWGERGLQDCFSLFTRESVKTERETVIYENMDFMKEAYRMKKIAELFNPVVH